MSTRSLLRRSTILLQALVIWIPTGMATAHAQDRPNILVIWGDDIGWENVSAYETLADYPPVQGGKSFDMSNVVEEFVKKARQ
jgi:hypothetical protein